MSYIFRKYVINVDSIGRFYEAHLSPSHSLNLFTLYWVSLYLLFIQYENLCIYRGGKL